MGVLSPAAPDVLGGAGIAVVQSPGLRAPAADVQLIRTRMNALAAGGAGELNIAQPLPTAAFSRRDTFLSGYREAEASALAYGFESMIRPVGGHLAVYDGGALILHLWVPHPEARVHVRARFMLLGNVLAKSLRGMGADARVGPVPGEYCDGEFSVNDSGRSKLVGTGQRITRAGYLFSAVVMVREVGVAREALTAAYSGLGLRFRPETVGCIADSVPGITLEDVRNQLAVAFGRVFRSPCPAQDYLTARSDTGSTSVPAVSLIHHRPVARFSARVEKR